MTIRLPGLPLLFVALLGLSACVEPPPTPVKWQTGFWYWHDNAAEAAPATAVPDVLFFHVGAIWKYASRNQPDTGEVSGILPASLPAAREYWLVFRDEQPGVPDVSAAVPLARRISSLLLDARRRHLNVVGIQLDIDSPTAALPRYADFLREVRKGMPAGLRLSITALLDWFRDGTSIAAVVEQSDEFVPQFYDVASARHTEPWSAIASKIDAALWAPKFRRLKKPFRIGIATFGRARFVPAPDPSRQAYAGLRLFGDLTPLDVAGNPDFNLQVSHNDAGELILTYLPARNTHLGNNDFRPGATLNFIIATPDSIRAAVEGARRMGANCAGVLFFRWPASNESLVMEPDETWIAAGLAPPRRQLARIEWVDGYCAAVSCADLWLVTAGAFSDRTLRYRIRASSELEYFMPEEKIPVRMTGPSTLELTLPPWAGRSRILLGRAVSATRTEFQVEEEP
ncbi:MAG: DUF3142 domain-containing protein [Acidobacteriota bacterium]